MDPEYPILIQVPVVGSTSNKQASINPNHLHRRSCILFILLYAGRVSASLWAADNWNSFAPHPQEAAPTVTPRNPRGKISPNVSINEMSYLMRKEFQIPSLIHLLLESSVSSAEKTGNHHSLAFDVVLAKTQAAPAAAAITPSVSAIISSRNHARTAGTSWILGTNYSYSPDKYLKSGWVLQRWTGPPGPLGPA